MNNLIKKCVVSAIGIIFALPLTTVTVAAQQTATEKWEQTTEGRKEAREAAQVLQEIMSKPDGGIPRELLERAEAIAIIPDVVKAAFIVGGRGGDGIVSRRTANGWSAPAYYDMGGASFGPQIGAKKTDYIMLFMNEGSLRDLLDEKVEFGGDLSFAAGPIGRTVGAGTNPTLDAGVLTYSRSKGAFIGASIKGAVLTADNDVNRAVYGMTAKEVLDNPAKINTASAPREVKSLLDTLKRYASKS